jgi:hypothetical protein
MDKRGLLGTSTVSQSLGDELSIPNTCGSCEYAQILPGDGQMILCGGVPPTPVPMGVNQNLAGQQQIVCQMFYPQLPMNQKRCALYEPRKTVIIGRPAGQA